GYERPERAIAIGESPTFEVVDLHPVAVQRPPRGGVELRPRQIQISRDPGAAEVELPRDRQRRDRPVSHDPGSAVDRTSHRAVRRVTGARRGRCQRSAGQYEISADVRADEPDQTGRPETDGRRARAVGREDCVAADLEVDGAQGDLGGVDAETGSGEVEVP